MQRDQRVLKEAGRVKTLPRPSGGAPTRRAKHVTTAQHPNPTPRALELTPKYTSRILPNIYQLYLAVVTTHLQISNNIKSRCNKRGATSLFAIFRNFAYFYARRRFECVFLMSDYAQLRTQS